MPPTMRTSSLAPLVSGVAILALLASCAGGTTTAPATPIPSVAPTSAPAPTAAPVAAASPAASSAPAASPAARASATAVHASYLDLTRNMTELRGRLAQWQGGDEQSLSTAKERAERVVAMLKHVAWPDTFTAGIGKLGAAMGALDRAISAKDAAASKGPSVEMAELSEDLEHAFYDRWLTEPGARHTRDMDVHTVYVDLTANIGELRSRIGEWEKGSADGLSSAKEKAERIGALVGSHATWPRAMSDPLRRIGTSLPAVEAALTAKDVARAKAAAAAIGEASHDLTHEVYEWMASAKAADASCLHTGYLDLTANIADLRSRVAEWEKGSESALSTATEKAERIDALVAHEQWPKSLSADVGRIRDALGPLSAALTAKDVKAAVAAAAAIGEASHDLAHEFYETAASTRME